MKLRLSLTLDITRHRPTAQPEGEPLFEHRDNDTAIEATYGGDHTLHRMGFQPALTPDEE